MGVSSVKDVELIQSYVKSVSFFSYINYFWVKNI